MSGSDFGQLAPERIVELQTGRSPAPFDGARGNLQEGSSLGLGQLLVPEQIENLFFLLGQAFDLRMKGRPGVQMARAFARRGAVVSGLAFALAGPPVDAGV